MDNSILNQLNGVRKSGDGYVAFCPAHEDVHNRSLSLTERDGKLLIHCFCGCSFGDILDKLNIQRPEHTKPELEAVYDYTNEDGTLLYQVLRYFPKSFSQRQPNGGDFVNNLKGCRRVLFQLPGVLTAVENGRVVYFCEGEKDALNLGQWVTTTTISGGASSKWLPEYSEALKDAVVAIVPDNDEPGHKYAEKIANHLYGWASIVKIVRHEAKDITEWLKTHNVDELQSLWGNTHEYIPKGAVTRDELQAVTQHLIYLSRKLNKSYKQKHRY